MRGVDFVASNMLLKINSKAFTTEAVENLTVVVEGSNESGTEKRQDWEHWQVGVPGPQGNRPSTVHHPTRRTGHERNGRYDGFLRQEDHPVVDLGEAAANH